jgi:dipeptidyl aminopeptidase/acylaminoacyl peptidase
MNVRTKTSVAALVCLSLVVFERAACGSGAQTAVNGDGKIVAVKNYPLPSFEQVKELARQWSKQDYERAVGDPSFEFQKLTYLSDGLKVIAYLYKPKQTDGKKLPAIIFNRGSYVRGDIAAELAPFFHRLALQGFDIIAPLYRGSDGGEGRDEMGGADLRDLMNTLPVAKSLDFIDASNLFMYGVSRGGMMTFQAIRDGFPVNAAAVIGAFTDLDELISSDPRQYLPLCEQIWPGFAAKREEIVKRRSALQWVERLNAPLLVMHGGQDRDVNPSHSLNLAQRLQRLGKTYELVIYAGDNHGLRRNQVERDRRAADWFKKHLK